MATMTLTAERRTTAPSVAVDRARIIETYRAQTEQAIAQVKYDAFLDDRERTRRITSVIAEANARMLALHRASR